MITHNCQLVEEWVGCQSVCWEKLPIRPLKNGKSSGMKCHHHRMSEPSLGWNTKNSKNSKNTKKELNQPYRLLVFPSFRLSCLWHLQLFFSTSKSFHSCSELSVTGVFHFFKEQSDCQARTQHQSHRWWRCWWWLPIPSLSPSMDYDTSWSSKCRWRKRTRSNFFPSNPVIREQRPFYGAFRSPPTLRLPFFLSSSLHNPCCDDHHRFSLLVHDLFHVVPLSSFPFSKEDKRKVINGTAVASSACVLCLLLVGTSKNQTLSFRSSFICIQMCTFSVIVVDVSFSSYQCFPSWTVSSPSFSSVCPHFDDSAVGTTFSWLSFSISLSLPHDDHHPCLILSSLHLLLQSQ